MYAYVCSLVCDVIVSGGGILCLLFLHLCGRVCFHDLPPMKSKELFFCPWLSLYLYFVSFFLLHFVINGIFLV